LLKLQVFKIFVDLAMKSYSCNFLKIHILPRETNTLLNTGSKTASHPSKTKNKHRNKEGKNPKKGGKGKGNEGNEHTIPAPSPTYSIFSGFPP
jgi:hypothetical protein